MEKNISQQQISNIEQPGQTIESLNESIVQSTRDTKFTLGRVAASSLGFLIGETISNLVTHRDMLGDPYNLSVVAPRDIAIGAMATGLIVGVNRYKNTKS